MKKSIFTTFFVVVFTLVGFLAFAPWQAKAADVDWKALQTGTTREFSSISCPEARTCFMVSGIYLSGGSGAIVRTTDGGDTFTLLKSPTLNPLHGISCPTTRTCYSAGDFGTFLKTTDGGETWVESLLGSKSNPSRFKSVLALDEQKVMVVGQDGAFYRTEDGGASWARPSLRSVADLSGLYFMDASIGFITGNDGTLFKTDDGGASWSYLKSLRATGNNASIHGKGAETIFAVGSGINKSMDKGETWTAQTVAAAKSYQRIAVPSAATAYIIADTNSIWRTADGGATWQLETTAPNTALGDIDCPSDSYCLAVGSSGKVLRRGTAPAPLPPPPPPPAPAPAPEPPAPAASAAPPVTIPPVPEAATPAPVAERPSVSEAVKTAVVAVFTRTIKKGANGNDVKKLQEILAGVAGIYPEGEITGYFGPATSKAVGRFQEKHNLVKPGEAGYGQAGPKTRAKLIEVLQDGEETDSTIGSAKTSQTTPAIFVRILKKGARGEDVKKLQEILSADKELYPEGEIIGYFGPATKRAVGKFQEKHDIARPGDAGYGDLGPKTRAKLKELSL